MRGRLVLAGAAVLALIGGGLIWAASDGGEGDTASPTSTTEAYAGGATYAGLPPNDGAALAEMYDPLLEPLGLRMTRGGLTDGPRPNDDPALRGRHLALYVEPLTGEFTPEQYFESLMATTRLFLPEVFDRWPGLASMDVCQEPPPGVDDRVAPPQVTVLEVTAEQAAAVEWAAIDLPGLVLAAEELRFGFLVNDDLQAHPAWKAAFVEAAARKAGADPSTTD